MKNKLFGLMLSAALFAIVACDNKDNDMTPPQTATPAVIKGTLFTFGEEEASTALELGKDLGMYMFKEGTADLVAPYENIKYQTASRPLGFLAPEVSDNVLYYPEDGSKVDIIAYYPYKNNMVNNTYPVNVANQKSSTNFNLYYAKNGKGLSKSNTKISLELRPVLTKLIFNLKAGDGVKDENLKDATSYISGMNTTADFNLLTATFGNLAGVKNIDLLPVDKQNSVTGQVLPSPTVNGYTMHLALPNMANATRQVNFTNFVNNDTFLTKLESNYRYTFNVIVSLEKVEVKLVEAKPVEDWTDGGSNVSGSVSASNEYVKNHIGVLPVGDLPVENSDVWKINNDTWGAIAKTTMAKAETTFDATLKQNVIHLNYTIPKYYWFNMGLVYRSKTPVEQKTYTLKFKVKGTAGQKLRCFVATHDTESFKTGTTAATSMFLIKKTTDPTYTNRIVDLNVMMTANYQEVSLDVDCSRIILDVWANVSVSPSVAKASTPEALKDFYLCFQMPNENASMDFYLTDVSFTEKK